jgi:hypothetical protein
MRFGCRSAIIAWSTGFECARSISAWVKDYGIVLDL